MQHTYGFGQPRLTDEGHADQRTNHVDDLDILLPWLADDIPALLAFLLALVDAKGSIVVEEFIEELGGAEVNDYLGVLLPAVLRLGVVEHVLVVGVNGFDFFLEVVIGLWGRR